MGLNRLQNWLTLQELQLYFKQNLSYFIMILIKLKFTGNKFVSTCCSEDVELGVIDPSDVKVDENEISDTDTMVTASEGAEGA